MPRGTDTITASPKPYSTRWAVAHRSAKSSPARAISHPASSTAFGDGRNTGDTTPLALITTHATNGTASDMIVSVHRAAGEMGVRIASSEDVRTGAARRGNGGHP